MSSIPDWQHFLDQFPIDIDGDDDVDVSIGSGERELSLRARDGELKLAGCDEHETELEIRLDKCAAEDLLLGKVATVGVFGDAEVSAGDGFGLALPALETILAPEEQFERIPGASLSVAIRVTSTIFGDVGIREVWRDGALESSELVPPAMLEQQEFDVGMWCSLAQLAAIRRRELTPLDALGSGVGLRGDWPQLMCFLELLQHPCFEAAWSSQPAIDAQVRWGTVFCSSAYGDAALEARARAEVEADGGTPAAVGG